MDGLVCEWLDGWMDKVISVWVVGLVAGWTNASGQLSGCVHGWLINGWTCMGHQNVGWMGR